MTDYNPSKTEKEVDRHQQRQNNFYSQTVSQNNVRLDAKFNSATTFAELRDATLEEIKFIESDLILRLRPDYGEI